LIPTIVRRSQADWPTTSPTPAPTASTAANQNDVRAGTRGDVAMIHPATMGTPMARAIE